MRREVRIGAVVAAVVVLLAAAGVLVANLVGGSAPTPECTVPATTLPGQLRTIATGTAGAGGTDTTGPVALDAVQLEHAATIDAVGLARAIPQYGRVIAIATAWQESGLRNLDHGDRDSLGLFQQRTSQGWGSPQQLMDPVYAAGAFYTALLKVSDWQSLPLTQAAQAVQKSGYPDAYAKWAAPAQAVTAALDGSQSPLTLSCRAGAQPPTAADPARTVPAGARAADPTLQVLLAAAAAEFGELTVDGISGSAPAAATGSTGAGGTTTSAPAGGSTASISVTLPGQSVAATARALAAWSVAHATGDHVVSVTVQGRRWTTAGWAPVSTPADAAGGSVLVTVDR